jgi:hypothetical protein
MHGGKVSPRALQISLCGDVEQSATGALSPFAVDRLGQALTAIGRLGCLSNRQHAEFHDSRCIKRPGGGRLSHDKPLWGGLILWQTTSGSGTP